MGSISSAAKVNLLSAAFVLAPDNSETNLIFIQVRNTLRTFSAVPSKASRYEIANALARRGDSRDLALLIAMLDETDPLIAPDEEPRTVAAWNTDIRLAAAYAILRIDRRQPHAMSLVDWGVIIAYGIGMVLIGWYYAGRNKTAEDYLLGGRKMNPVMVERKWRR